MNSFHDPLGSSVFFSQRSAETFARLWRSGRAQYLSRLKQGRLIRGTSALFLHKQVGFVLGDDVGDAARLEGSDEPLVEGSHAAGGVHHEHGNVGLVQGGFGPLDAQVAHVAGVVDARGVDDEHGAGRRQLHGLAHRVGGGAGNIGHHGDGLVRQRVHQAGLAGVAHPEEDDVRALAGRGIVQGHAGSFRCRFASVGGDLGRPSRPEAFFLLRGATKVAPYGRHTSDGLRDSG